MALSKWISVVVFTFIVCLCASSSDALPEDVLDNEYPSVVNVLVNNHWLYTSARQSKDPCDVANVKSILKSILIKHKINVDQVNIPQVLKTLTEKIRYLFRTLKNVSRSDHKKKKTLRNWQKSNYTLRIPHRTGSPTKKQLKHVKDELAKTNDDLTETNKKFNKLKEENVELGRKVDRLSNPRKRKAGERGKTKGKLEYSESQQRRHKKQRIESIETCLSDFSSSGWNPINVTFKDEFGDEVVICGEPFADNLSDDDVDEFIFVMDQFNIPNAGYHELSMLAKKHCSKHGKAEKSIIPNSNSVITRRKNLNSGIEIKPANNDYPGVYTSLTDSLISKLSDPKRAHLLETRKVRIKLSGDGTNITCKQSFVNLSYTLVDEKTSMSEHGNYLLAIVKCHEDSASLKKALRDLIQEFEDLTSVTVNGERIEIDKYLGGDLKYLNQIMGIAGFGSSYSCLWCHCSSSERFDMKRSWSMSDPKLGARTVEGIIRCAHKGAKDPTKYNCISEPLFPSVPVHKVVPDKLHLCLRIGDQLVKHLKSYLQKLDNIDRCRTFTAAKLTSARNLMKFQDFVHNVVGILDWKFFIKDGKLDHRPFRGPEHRKLLAKIDLDFLVPNHPKLSELKQLWQGFSLILAQMDKTLTHTEIDEFEIDAKKWVDLCYYLGCSTDITPYMHVMACHVPEAMRLHGNISHFCQQGLEKVNELVTRWYKRSTNFGKDSYRQIMAKQHRLHLLQDRCKRTPKWTVQCSNCNQKGHNRQTCGRN